MPCFTRVTVEVMDRAAAEEALKKLGYDATITKNANGKFTVTGASGKFNESKFRTEYAAAVATKKAKAAGYFVTRKEVGDQVELILRQWA